ncbi:ABC transporter substrate-binding protein [Plantactinospora sp. KLBMP9567]|uniref:ABC transporter substrate-binding protein n=1 Tax=Plantactinospora sp. KLBMP9567 TaxID=3085900 RepID=UPI0029829DC6|nr:ABC transporter substrate-binding protein [Plantactinospora sp. KLBMP9567]MDW5328392.1 ABC transporter substrate-binding protein [Plantactinospora sp. KLBMP9567]
MFHRRRPPRWISASTRTTLALVLAAGALSSCSLDSGSVTAAGEESASGEVLVGVALPFSGAVSRTGNLYRKGIELRLKQAEESGELGDMSVKVDFQDDANNPSEAVPLVTRFAQAGAVAMFGAHSSPVALAQANAVQAAGLPEFVFGASNSIKNPFQYQVNARDSEQIKNVINFAARNNFRRVGIFTDTGAYGTSAKQQLDAILGASDLEIVGSETFEPTASNLAPQLVSLRRKNPDFVAMFSFGTPYAAVVKGKAEIGWNVPIVGNVAAGDIAVGEIAGKDADGLYFMTPLGDESQASRALADSWAKAYPDDPLTFEGATAYDAMTVLIRALKQGGTSRQAVQEWLSKATAIEGLACGKSPWNLTERAPIKADDLAFRLWKTGETVAV